MPLVLMHCLHLIAEACTVWSDGRTGSIVDGLKEKFRGADHFRSRCGLPLSTYFRCVYSRASVAEDNSAMKIKWLLENSPQVKSAVAEERCLFGTVDSWLLWVRIAGFITGFHVISLPLTWLDCL